MAVMSASRSSLLHRTYPEAESFTNLPSPVELPESVFLVRKGRFLHHRGLYRSDGKHWKRISKTPVTRAELEQLQHEIAALKLRIEKVELK